MYRSSCKVPGVLVWLSRNLNFLDIFSKNTPMRNFIKIHSGGPKIFDVDRETNGMTDYGTWKQIIAFRKFLKALKIEYSQQYSCNLNNEYRCTTTEIKSALPHYCYRNHFTDYSLPRSVDVLIYSTTILYHKPTIDNVPLLSPFFQKSL